MERIKGLIVAEFTRVGGRHDDPRVYAGPPGDPGLIGPGSVSWVLHSDMAALSGGGTAAIVMELLHPQVMAGVHDFSGYQDDSFRRARTTLGYVICTTFGNTQAAERLIAGVRRMHERVAGTAPDGAPYRAMDPDLLGWVHTCIPWAVMRAYERSSRPLSPSERDRYLAEQSVIAAKSGAGRVPVTMEELDDYAAAMRPKLTVNDQTRAFFEFGKTGPFLPRALRPLGRPLHSYDMHAGMALMPAWAQELTGYRHHRLLDTLIFEPHARLDARLMRWAFGMPPFRAMAEARAANEPVPCQSATPPV
ncbi:oxygenase MpaB family protein [Actinomadura sp. 7K507]|uniref:oxygenase MpaB family protein n=1 Tax=Actinomadura sp. 7K507 TaxID=2530365 RepID=UPI001A9EDB36|nr:oxygenase MpaB family protein [Actinomadura sp. 7K507]